MNVHGQREQVGQRVQPLHARRGDLGVAQRQFDERHTAQVREPRVGHQGVVAVEHLERARADGKISKDLPTEVVLFTIYARSCDPTLDYLRSNEQYTVDQGINFLLSTCFDGLA